ncbi:hypothetical protein BKA69DRAFT_1126324 [Paraphysoderma sedebokerense]|nr:hypothetical protein BKA69DRAFT_1126324 [Paraphysoderma sedebokerense]
MTSNINIDDIYPTPTLFTKQSYSKSPEQTRGPFEPKILFVIAFNSQRSEKDLQTLAHIYSVLSKRYLIEFASIDGPLSDLNQTFMHNCESDPICKQFSNNKGAMGCLYRPKSIEQCQMNRYVAVVFPGGFRDFEGIRNEVKGHLGQAIAKVYEHGGQHQCHLMSNFIQKLLRYHDLGVGVIATCGSALAALMEVKLSNGEYLLKNRQFTGLSTEEIKSSGVSIPYNLGEKLKTNSYQADLRTSKQNFPHCVVDWGENNSHKPIEHDIHEIEVDESGNKVIRNALLHGTDVSDKERIRKGVIITGQNSESAVLVAQNIGAALVQMGWKKEE